MNTKVIYENALDEEIVKQLEAVSKDAMDTKSLANSINSVTELIDRSIKLKELETNEYLKLREQENTLCAELEKVNAERKSKRNELFGKLALGIGSVAVVVWGTIYSTKAELIDGYIPSTSAGRNFTNDIFKFIFKN